MKLWALASFSFKHLHFKHFKQLNTSFNMYKAKQTTAVKWSKLTFASCNRSNWQKSTSLMNKTRVWELSLGQCLHPLHVQTAGLMSQQQETHGAEKGAQFGGCHVLRAAERSEAADYHVKKQTKKKHIKTQKQSFNQSTKCFWSWRSQKKPEEKLV